MSPTHEVGKLKVYSYVVCSASGNLQHSKRREQVTKECFAEAMYVRPLIYIIMVSLTLANDGCKTTILHWATEYIQAV